MLEPLQMRAPSKRWLALASIIFVSTASLAWSFTRLRRTGKFEGAPALKTQKAESTKQTAASNFANASDSGSKAQLIDSDNDGIPDVEELRTYQDRDSFRRWFTAIAETQFYQPWVQKFPYHVMIFLGPVRVASNGAQDWVVYHTGSSPNDKGTVKKVELSVLDHHPDPRWRPLESNRNFLGFYRLKILH